MGVDQTISTPCLPIAWSTPNISFQMGGCNSPLSSGKLFYTYLGLTRGLGPVITHKLMGSLNIQIQDWNNTSDAISIINKITRLNCCLLQKWHIIIPCIIAQGGYRSESPNCKIHGQWWAKPWWTHMRLTKKQVDKKQAKPKLFNVRDHVYISTCYL